MADRRVWEMGSEFHVLTDFRDVRSDHLPYSGTLFANGRSALRSIIASLHLSSNTCWIPSYICAEVLSVLSEMVRVRVYGDYPDDVSPQFETLAPEAGDVVIIQDTFGLGDPVPWEKWKRLNPHVILVEDISHNSTQERFLESPADYVFSSVRKTIPVADGGIIFSRGDKLRQATSQINDGSQLKLEAMLLKAMYLRGYPVEKQVFRDLQIAGEEALNNSKEEGSLSHTLQMLCVLPHQALRSRWQRNNERLALQLNTSAIADLAQLLPPRGTHRGLFHTVLKCRDRKVRDTLRAHLISNSVFPAVHWQQNHSLTDDRARGLGDSLLTVPTDFRYGEKDIDMLAHLIIEGVKRI